jgi:anthranilate/para-aminobenzoate synthase component I
VARLPPNPLAVARALAGRPGLAVLASQPQGAPARSDARWSFVACDPVEASDDLVPPVPLPEARAATGYGGAIGAPRWVGVVPYEALRALERPAWTRAPDDRPPAPFARPAWLRYAAVVRIDHATGDVAVEADDTSAASRLARALDQGWGRVRARSDAPANDDARAVVADAGISDEADAAADATHLARVAEALRLIAAGDLYEVNLARRLRLRVCGELPALLEALVGAAPAPWGFLADFGDRAVCATSPELAISVRGKRLRTCPIKGTRPRGPDAAADARLAAALASDEKERAELTMAVDVHRSDLGRVAVPGTVRVLGEPRLVPGCTVWSRVAEVVAERAAGVSLADVVRAVLPCGSVTGAPKVRAMEVIAHLEPWRRGVYTGAFGYVGRDGGLELAMAIRTLELEGRGPERAASYFTGGGIVWGSTPERELEETRWKAVQLQALLTRAGSAQRASGLADFGVYCGAP